MNLKEIMAPDISDKEYQERYDLLHRKVYANPTFDFDSVTKRIYKAPEGYYTADHCLVNDGTDWHLYYVTGEIKNFEPWLKAYSNGDEATYRKYQYEIGDGHAVGEELDGLTFKNIILTEPQGDFDTSTRGNVHIVRHKDHWVALYQVRGPRGSKICAARSDDLYNWVPDSKNPAFGPPEWASSNHQCKDVHIVPWKGAYLVYYIALGKDNLQAVALKVTENFEDYVEIGPVLKAPNMARGTRGVESPCIVERNGLWHLFFGWGIYGIWHVASSRPGTFMGSDTLEMGEYGTARYQDYGIYVFAPFHAVEIINHDGAWFATTTKKEELRRKDCEDRILKYRATLGDEMRLTHGIYMSSISWEDDYPVCKKP